MSKLQPSSQRPGTPSPESISISPGISASRRSWRVSSKSLSAGLVSASMILSSVPYSAHAASNRNGLTIAKLAERKVENEAAPKKDKGDEKEETKAGDASEAQAAAPGPIGGRVAILRFNGSAAQKDDLRGMALGELEKAGFTASGVRVDIEGAAKKNKCETKEIDCLKRIGTYLNKNAREKFNFYLFATVNGPQEGGTQMVFFDIDQGKIVAELAGTPTPNDYVLWSAMPLALGQRATRYQQPLPQMSEEERAALDNPGDPEKTPEQIEQEKKILAESQKKAAQQKKEDDVQAVKDLDLKRDFDKVCRKGPRQDSEEIDIEGKSKTVRDLRPPCSRGPFFGYLQPRTYALAGATVVSALAMATFYTLSLVARSKYKSALSEFQNEFGSEQDAKDLVKKQEKLFDGRECANKDEKECYVNLAGKVSEATDGIRKNALYGDVALGVTVAFAGITAIMMFQDRNDAKKYLKERQMLQLSDFRLTPYFSKQGYGAAAGFKF